MLVNGVNYTIFVPWTLTLDTTVRRMVMLMSDAELLTSASAAAVGQAEHQPDRERGSRSMSRDLHG